MRATIWTAPACERCDTAKRMLREAEIDFVEVDADDLMNPDHRNVDALAELNMRDGALPLIHIETIGFCGIDDVTRCFTLRTENA